LLNADGGGGTIELGAGMQLGDGGLHTFSKGDTNLNSHYVQAGYVTSRADGKITVGGTFVEVRAFGETRRHRHRLGPEQHHKR
jgi:hypothetical protein